jgi:ABC-2 type transport system ATP-binding protein
MTVIGLQWGDEGKGKVAAYFSRAARLAVRFNGGPNAGHTILYRGRVLRLHLVPAGGVVCGAAAICAGVLVDLRVGAILQESESFNLLTVRETLRLYGRLYGADARRAEELMELLDLREHANRLYGKLSGGLRRRVLLAAALINDPELVFLDEPTTGLDPGSRRDVWSVLKGMRKEGVTVFLTTHYMEEAEALADRVGIIVNGKMVAIGSPGELAEKYGGSKTIRVSGIRPEVAERLQRELGGARIENGELVWVASNQTEVNRIVQAVITASPEAVFSVRNPGLEEVFLRLTGRRITEEGGIA